MKFENITCITDQLGKAHEVEEYLISNYPISRLSETNQKHTDLIIVLGGDGFMLHTLHKYMALNVPFYGINIGHIGFLLNKCNTEGLLNRLEQAQPVEFNPLFMEATDIDGKISYFDAINEVSIYRASNQVAKLKIFVNGESRLEELIADGALVSTPAGSSAYNFSAGGSIFPLNSKLLALTAISPYRPRRWTGALLPHNSLIKFEVLEIEKRPVNAVADFNQVENIRSVSIHENEEKTITLLFDSDLSLQERIIIEQFSY